MARKQRYIVVEEGHRVYAQFSVESGKSVRVTALDVVGFWNFEDPETQREGVIVYDPSPSGPVKGGISVYAVPSEFPEYGEDEGCDELDETFADGWSAFTLVAGIEFLYPDAGRPRLARMDRDETDEMTISAAVRTMRGTSTDFQLTFSFDGAGRVVLRDGKRGVAEIRAQVEVAMPGFDRATIGKIAREFGDQIEGKP